MHNESFRVLMRRIDREDFCDRSKGLVAKGFVSAKGLMSKRFVSKGFVSNGRESVSPRCVMKCPSTE